MRNKVQVLSRRTAAAGRHSTVYVMQTKTTFENINIWRTLRNLLHIWKSFFINASSWSLGTAGKSRSDFSPQLQSTDLRFGRKTTGMKMTAKMPGFLEQQICIWAQTKLHWFMLLTLSHKCCWHKRLPTKECLTAPSSLQHKLAGNSSYPRSWTPEMKATIQKKLCQEKALKFSV